MQNNHTETSNTDTVTMIDNHNNRDNDDNYTATCMYIMYHACYSPKVHANIHMTIVTTYVFSILPFKLIL